MVQFNPLLPELYVSDFANSLHFYCEIIGFHLEYRREEPPFAFLSYQGSQLMLQELVEGEQEAMGLEYPFGRGMNFQIHTPDVAVLLNALSRHHYPVKRGVKESWYREAAILHGHREILVLDPDGYLLRFSQRIGVRPVLASQTFD